VDVRYDDRVRGDGYGYGYRYDDVNGHDRDYDHHDGHGPGNASETTRADIRHGGDEHRFRPATNVRGNHPLNLFLLCHQKQVPLYAR